MSCYLQSCGCNAAHLRPLNKLLTVFCLCCVSVVEKAVQPARHKTGSVQYLLLTCLFYLNYTSLSGCKVNSMLYISRHICLDVVYWSSTTPLLSVRPFVLSAAVFSLFPFIFLRLHNIFFYWPQTSVTDIFCFDSIILVWSPSVWYHSLWMEKHFNVLVGF